MKGFRLRRVPSGLVAVLGALVLASSLSAASGPAKTSKEELPAVLDKEAPASIEDLKTIQQHVKKVLKKVVPATVGIQVGGASGSGVIIDAEGHVLTAGHVSGKPDRDCVILLPDGKRLKGKTLGQNTGIDSGLIKITDKGNWPFVKMGDASKLKKGQWCLSVGQPGGFKPGRSPVVRLGRILMANKSVIQSDCTLVGGDSGGPLFDMEGKVIGIHSRIGSRIIDNLHVPVNTYRDTWDRLVRSDSWGGFFGRSERPYLGVGFARETNDLEVTDVYDDTPAAKAGLKVGDVVVAIDGKKLRERKDLADYLGTKKIGDEVTIAIERDKKPMSIKVKLGKRPTE
jgi:serine protease Do